MTRCSSLSARSFTVMPSTNVMVRVTGGGSGRTLDHRGLRSLAAAASPRRRPRSSPAAGWPKQWRPSLAHRGPGGPGSGRSAADHPHHHARRGHDRQGSGRQARGQGQGRHEGHHRAGLADDDQQDARRGNRDDARAPVRRRGRGPHLRGRDRRVRERGVDGPRMRDARTGRHGHGPRRPRQDDAARRDPRRPTSPSAKPAASRSTSAPIRSKSATAQHRVPRYARSRSVHDDARPRREGHRHRRPRGRGRRRRHAADDRGDRPREGGQGADHRRDQQDRQAGRQPRAGQARAVRARIWCPKSGAATRSWCRSRPRSSRTSISCSR